MKNLFATLLAIAVLCGCVGCHPQPNTNTTTTQGSTTVTTTDGSVTTTTDEGATTTTTTAVTTTPSKKPVSKPAVTTTKAKPTQTKSTSKKVTTTTAPKVVQAADPETGISWDGKSPIIYTYEDGSTGTEKKEGATYEYEPGVIFSVPPDLSNVVDDGLCDYCGKKEGSGKNGTCNRYFFDDVNCRYCNELVKAGCHTCKK